MISRAEMQPKWDGEAFVPRLIMPFSLSYDHRVIDGAEGVRFTSYLGSCWVISAACSIALKAGLAGVWHAMHSIDIVAVRGAPLLP